MDGDDFTLEGGKLPELKLGLSARAAPLLVPSGLIRQVAHSLSVLFSRGWTDARQAQGFISFFKRLPQVRLPLFLLLVLVSGGYFGGYFIVG